MSTFVSGSISTSVSLLEERSKFSTILYSLVRDPLLLYSFMVRNFSVREVSPSSIFKIVKGTYNVGLSLVFVAVFFITFFVSLKVSLDPSMRRMLLL